LGGPEHAGAVFARLLVRNEVVFVLSVALVEDRFDLGDGELVIEGSARWFGRFERRGVGGQRDDGVLARRLVCLEALKDVGAWHVGKL
jgi:hypothetical protein